MIINMRLDCKNGSGVPGVLIEFHFDVSPKMRIGAADCNLMADMEGAIRVNICREDDLG
jgi:hypothetical protein